MTKKRNIPPQKQPVTDKTPAFNEEAPVEIQVVNFDQKKAGSFEPENVAALKKCLDKDKINLVFINNLTEQAIIDEVAELFRIDSLMMENALSQADLPGVMESGNEMLLTLKILDYTDSGKLINRHIGLLLGEYFVIVFKDSETTIFEEIRNRIQNGASKARLKKPDYLFYLLVDAVIDTYYVVVNEIDNKIDRIEVILLEKPEKNYINELYRIKQPMIEMRSVLYPTREALSNVVQGDYSLIEDETLPFLHDVKDHINNIVQMFDSSRDTLSDLLEINYSNINNRLNDSMRILTIITTIFIPLTVITGIYGMNFKHMPELSSKWGYPAVLATMLVTAIIMYLFMKRKKIL